MNAERANRGKEEEIPRKKKKLKKLANKLSKLTEEIGSEEDDGSPNNEQILKPSNNPVSSDGFFVFFHMLHLFLNRFQPSINFFLIFSQMKIQRNIQKERRMCCQKTEYVFLFKLFFLVIF